MENYKKYKSKLLEEAGYEEHKSKIIFNTAGDSTEDLIDSLLGLEREISITDFQEINTRFGEEETVLRHEKGTIKLQRLSPPLLGSISFSEPKNIQKIKMDAEIHVLPSEIKHEKIARIKTEFLDITINHKNTKINFNFDNNKISNLDSLIKIYKTMDMLKEPQKLINFCILFNSKAIEFTIKTEIALENTEEILKNLVYLKKISNEFDFFDEIHVSINRLLNNRIVLEFLIYLIEKKPVSVKIGTGKPEENGAMQEYESMDKFIFLRDLTIDLGGILIKTILSITTEKKLLTVKEDGRIEAFSSQINIEEKLIYEKGETPNVDLMQQASEKLSNKHHGCAIWTLLE